MAVDRAAFFVDGNNWFHGCVQLGLADLGRLNYARVCQKLVGPRQWSFTRYYIGRVPQIGNLRLAADQQRFLALLQAQDPRISVHLGRIEPRLVTNEAALEIKHYLAVLKLRIHPAVYRDLGLFGSGATG